LDEKDIPKDKNIRNIKFKVCHGCDGIKKLETPKNKSFF